MKEEVTIKSINTAISDLQEALLENIEASKAVENAMVRKTKARFVLLKAKERLTGIERDFM